MAIVLDLILGRAPGWVGSYSYRVELDAHVVHDGTPGDRPLLIRGVLYWELWDPKTRKSEGAHGTANRKDIVNETRPFYGHSNVEVYFRWAEPFEIQAPPWWDGNCSSLPIKWLDPSGETYRLPLPGDPLFDNDNDHQIDETRRPPPDYQNGDLDFYDEWLKARDAKNEPNG